LPVSGRIAYLLPFDTLLYATLDPCTIPPSGRGRCGSHFRASTTTRTAEGRLVRPRTAPKPDPENDWLIEIYEGRFVGIILGAKDKDVPLIYGDLRSEGTRFVSWFPFHQQNQFSGATEEIAPALLHYKAGGSVAKWEHPFRWSDRLDPDFLDYQYEDHGGEDDPLGAAGEGHCPQPVFKTTVNVALAVRKALRRYLGIEPAAVASEKGEDAHDPDEILIEDTGVGTALVAELQDAGLSAIAVKPELDKRTRMSIQSGKFESGRVLFPNQAPWLADLETELFAFPNGRHDDQVESISQALARKVSENEWTDESNRGLEFLVRGLQRGLYW
jgi:predicted phage terminase large subunit-like protein